MRRLRLIHVWVRSNYPAAGLNEEPGARWRLRAADDLDVDARLLGEFSGGGAMFGQLVLAAASSRRRTAGSCSLAAVTSTARSRPVVSVRMVGLAAQQRRQDRPGGVGQVGWIGGSMT